MGVSRRPRIQIPDGHYHVVSRGNNKQQVFLDARDHHIFLDVVAQTLSQFRWRCLTYCLMPNHYHLVVRTPNADLSGGMRHINSLYAQTFNRRHGRCGHLFQGRFGGRLIQSQLHLLESIRYVALNPVRAGLVRHPEEWPWSAHAELCGRSRKRLVSVDELLANFSATREAALVKYREFVESDRSDFVKGSDP